MYSLTSSITCIVVGFILNEKYSQRFDQALRRKRQTFRERLPGRRYRLPGPPSQKAADVKAIRSGIRAIAADWFRTHLPGLFSSGIIAGEFSTCEFITLRKATPFPARDERDRGIDEWLRLLDIDHDFEAWQAEELLGLKFSWPLLRDRESRFHAVVAAQEDTFPEDRLRSYGGSDRFSNVHYVDERVNGMLSRWGLLGVLSQFERHLNNIRDSAVFDSHHSAKPLQVLEGFGSHVAHSVDISAASVELKHFAEQKFSFERELETFKPRNER